MEWFGEKMLPRGLPELAYEIVPSWVSTRLKIITLPKKEYAHIRGLTSYSHDNYFIRIYPTIILKDWKMRPGVISFQDWCYFLEVFLHELGHVMTHDKWKHISEKEYCENSTSYEYVEYLADQWRDITLNKIASRDSRLGQPIGWIGGLPGIYLMRSHYIREQDRYGPYEMKRINNYRAYRCHGQIQLLEVVNKLWNEYNKSYDNFGYDEVIKRNKIYRMVKKISSDLGIQRLYIDKTGRKHIFFNHGEADSVLNQTRNWLEIERANILKELLKEEMEKQQLTESLNQAYDGITILEL